MKQIHAIIFDRDDTLLKFDPACVAALEARVAAIAPTIPNQAVVAHWSNWPGPWPRTPEDEPAFWENFWSSLADRHGLPFSAAAALIEIGAFYHTCFVPYHDTLRTVQRLREHGFRLAILTNFELPSIGLTLQNAGMDPNWFDALIATSTLGTTKPDPRPYLATAAALGLAPELCAFVDNLPAHVEAARALGMQAWLIDRKLADQPPPPGVVPDLDTLVTYLTNQPNAE